MSMAPAPHADGDPFGDWPDRAERGPLPASSTSPTSYAVPAASTFRDGLRSEQRAGVRAPV
jgi:hypothetical protein